MEVAASPPCAINAVGKRKGRCFGTASPYLYGLRAPGWPLMGRRRAGLRRLLLQGSSGSRDVYNRDKEAARKRQNREGGGARAGYLSRYASLTAGAGAWRRRCAKTLCSLAVCFCTVRAQCTNAQRAANSDNSDA